MAHVKQTITTSAYRRKKIPDGQVQCNVCHGKGYHAKPNRTKKTKP